MDRNGNESIRESESSVTKEGFARLAFEAHYDDEHGDGGWDAWETLGTHERAPWLKVGSLIEACIDGAAAGSQEPAETPDEPAKVIVVTETPVSGCAPVGADRRAASSA